MTLIKYFRNSKELLGGKPGGLKKFFFFKKKTGPQKKKFFFFLGGGGGGNAVKFCGLLNVFWLKGYKISKATDLKVVIGEGEMLVCLAKCSEFSGFTP